MARAEVIQCWAGINGLLSLTARGLIEPAEAHSLIDRVRNRCMQALAGPG